MPYNLTNPVTVGFATEKPQWDRLWDNVKALACARIERALGGSDTRRANSTTYGLIPSGVYVTVNWDEVSALTHELEIMCSVLTGTGKVQLYDVTGAPAAYGSEYTFTNTTPGLNRYTIAASTGSKTYALYVKDNASGDGALVWGAKLIHRL